MNIFRRKPKASPEEEILVANGWTKIGESDAESSVWVSPGGLEWTDYESATTEVLRLCMPEPEEQEWR